MPQLFHPKANSLAWVVIIVVLSCVGGGVGLLYALQSSTYVTDVNMAKEQPVPFSHEHHVSGVGLDCRYCHYTVETSANATIPPPGLCMNCHKQVWADQQMLKPIRDAYKNDTPIEWNKVHDLPDFAYFNHSAHINKGVGCATCHGKVNEMPLMWKSQRLYMAWCLDCHRNPGPNLRPKDQVTNMTWHSDEAWDHEDRLTKNGVHRVPEGHINQLTNCYVCHR